ncbi:PREDICTED: uncharacterized protein LOC109167417 [Ipomoea nil]|uniref:uncharacterized protein LOC109167417 n=1 Tax=Ipomoea nil TaxID=35883 RepID=UPI000901C188|nr:PREDICTED: uncharacterized protein LOC109167417 [Ipomoea nil]
MGDILKQAGMSDCKPHATPASIFRVESSDELYENPTQYRSLAGALQYLTITRPDLSYAVNHSVSSCTYSPTVGHWELLKRILRYFKATVSLGYDSDWAGCSVDRKSTSGFAVFCVLNLVSWVCHKQRTVARLCIEAEYKALADVSAEVTWIVSLLQEIGFPPGATPRLWCDNLGATYLCANPVFHARTKDVEINFYFVQDKVASGELQVSFISTKD